MSYHYIEAEDYHKVTNVSVGISADLSRPANLPEVRIDEIFAERKLRSEREVRFSAREVRFSAERSPIGSQQRDKR